MMLWDKGEISVNEGGAPPRQIATSDASVDSCNASSERRFVGCLEPHPIGKLSTSRRRLPPIDFHLADRRRTNALRRSGEPVPAQWAPAS
jgi:hypothetical protein